MKREIQAEYTACEQAPLAAEQLRAEAAPAALSRMRHLL